MILIKLLLLINFALSNILKNNISFDINYIKYGFLIIRLKIYLINRF